MDKIKLGVIYGGMSTENEVSVKSAKSVMKNLDSNKYEVFPIYISKEGIWFLDENEQQEIENITKYLDKIAIKKAHINL